MRMPMSRVSVWGQDNCAACKIRHVHLNRHTRWPGHSKIGRLGVRCNLAAISHRVSVGAIALLVLDGWHSSPQLSVPQNTVLLPLPPYSPELYPMENVWEFHARQLS